eukprot:637764-Rhodomonas_salina.1
MPRRSVRHWREEVLRQSEEARKQCEALMDEAQQLLQISDYEAAKAKHGIAMSHMATGLRMIETDDHELVTRVHTNWGILSKHHGIKQNDPSILKEAEASFQRAIESAEKSIKDLRDDVSYDSQYLLFLQVRARIHLGNIEIHRNNLDEALSILVRCMMVCTKSEYFKQKQADCLSAIALIYEKQNKLPQAEA